MCQLNTAQDGSEKASCTSATLSALHMYIKHIHYTTAAMPASEVEAVVKSPTNMATAKIVAVEFNKMTPK